MNRDICTQLDVDRKTKNLGIMKINNTRRCLTISADIEIMVLLLQIIDICLATKLTNKSNFEICRLVKTKILFTFFLNYFVKTI